MNPSTDITTTASTTTATTPTPPHPPSSPPLPPSAAKAASVDPLATTSPVVTSPSPSPAPAPPARKPQLGFSLAPSSAAFAFSPIPAQPTHDSNAFSSAPEPPSIPPLKGFASAAQALQKQREPKKRGLADFNNGGGDDEPRSFFQTANQGRKRQQVQEQQLGPAKAVGGASDLHYAFEVTAIGLQYYKGVAALLAPSSRFALLREPENEHDEDGKIAVFLLPERDGLFRKESLNFNFFADQHFSQIFKCMTVYLTFVKVAASRRKMNARPRCRGTYPGILPHSSSRDDRRQRSGLFQSGRTSSRENASGLMLVSPSAPGAGVHFSSRSSNFNKCQVNGHTLEILREMLVCKKNKTERFFPK